MAEPRECNEFHGCLGCRNLSKGCSCVVVFYLAEVKEAGSVLPK